MMATIHLTTDQTDDVEFVGLVQQIIGGAVATHQPREVCVVKIDNWFDHKWLEFSGKTLGTLGVWKVPPTIPPFVANRIVGQWHYDRDNTIDGYQRTGTGKEIHHRGWSAENLHRPVKQVAPHSALFWYSGNTLATGRGSLMGYIPVEDEMWPWFLAFIWNAGWQVAKRKSIHEYEVRLFRTAGEALIRETACG